MNNNKSLRTFNFTKLTTSQSKIRIGDVTLSASALIQQGRKEWKHKERIGFSGIVNFSSIKMVSMLYTAIVDEIDVILADSDKYISSYCSEIITEQGSLTPINSAKNPNIISHMEGLAVLSSGSLGRPKLIFHNRSNFVKNCILAMDRLALKEQDRVLITVPVHHMYGLGAALFPSLLGEADILLLPNANLLSFNEAIKTFQPTITFSTPHLLQTILRRKRLPIASSRGIVLAGDGISEVVYERAKDAFRAVYNLYGSSELGVIAISPSNAPSSLVALESVEVFPKEESKDNCTLLVKHPYRATHILNNNRLSQTEEVWDTRDIATINNNLSFSVHGRADLSINRSGKLLIFADLEREIMTWQGVNTVIVITFNKKSKKGKAISALIKTNNKALTETKLKSIALEKLPAFARPDNYKIVTNMPFLKNGKPDRKALVEEYHCG